ncbi:GNAT family N-acetyltransferase [Inhella sp.]|uniref:GNAT family N-acetyltransferase n=1 Tax=Inhella sp. TaxID=1921806 RepID=UPI0035B330B7
MRREDIQIVVLEKYSDVQPYLADVVRWGDSDKVALGFLPSEVYGVQAQKGNLFVATTLSGGRLQYAGHLLFDARHPRASVLQIFVMPEARRLGTARRLLDQLKAHLTELHFIFIYASVAEELQGANAFWERNGFYVQRMRPGGKTRKRTILVRSHELGSPQLFERSGISSGNPFGLSTELQGEKPIYLLDLNVLLDLRPRRPRNELALDLFYAERHGACQLALSSELRSELQRTASTAPRSDPMQSWAATFITFPVPADAGRVELIHALGALVFPNKARGMDFSPNDLSDLTHLATAVHHRLTGFITNDDAILAAAGQIEEKFNIHVVSPLVFQPASDRVDPEEQFETEAVGEPLTIARLQPEGEDSLRQMLRRLGIADADAIGQWGALDTAEKTLQRWAVYSADHLVGYLASPRKLEMSVVVGRIALDEADANANAAGRLLMSKLLARAKELAPSRVSLHLAPRQVAAKEMALALGFSGAASGSALSKLVLNRVVTFESWAAAVRDLEALAQLRLPSICPIYKGIDQQFEVLCPDGNRRYVPLHEVETSLAPAILCLPGRPAVITPIQKDFAEHLLEHSPQGSFLPRARAAQYLARHYISAERTLKLFTRGTIILFYESGRGGGAAAIVAVGRVQRAYLKQEQAIGQADLNPSVLNSQTLAAIGTSKTKTVTVFDNLIVLPKPVPLSSLQSMGCGAANQLISTRLITSEQLHAILGEALAQ